VDTFTLQLDPVDERGAVSFVPGQFNMLYLPGAGEVPISVSGDPAQAKHLTHTIRSVGAVTKVMDKLKRGDLLAVRGPFGTHWPVEEAEGNDIVIIAGGLGLAPLRPAFYQVLSDREKYNKVVLLYGARTPQDLLYRHELERWRGLLDVQVEVTVDSPVGGWHGDVGVITTLIPRGHFDPARTVALVCGPEIMMRYTVMELEKREVSQNKIFVSIERNMKCATGFCGHCQLGPIFICKDGPIFRFDLVKDWLGKRDI
ncbi:MAG: FAD/NAD(P)-binding protein, partial [Chloroflexota bacterium]